MVNEMKSIGAAILNYIKSTDKLLILLALLTTGYGMLILAGVFDAFLSGMRGLYVQIAGTAFGIVCAVILSLIDYRVLGKLWKIHVPLAYALVMATFVIGYGRAGAGGDNVNWIALPFGASLQPSEFLKISFILSFAYHLDKVKDNINQPLTLLALCLHGAAPVLIIHLQGDDGMAAVFIFIFAAMLFTAGLSFRYLLAAGVLAVAAVPLAWIYVLTEDQKMRFHAILTPGIDPLGVEWQQNAGLITLGSGRLSGIGLFSDSHRFVDEIQNDFIFAFIGESFGLIGTVAALCLIFGVAAKILFISRSCKDLLGQSICVGIFAMIAGQTVINVGMCLKLLPVIGITLPFFSRGGSSILSIYLALGLALSVYMHQSVTLFSDNR